MSAKEKTLLFCTSYVKDAFEWKSRYSRWLAHQQQIKPEDFIVCVIDDGSPYFLGEQGLAVYSSINSIPKNISKPFVFRYEDRLGRSSLLSYPGWWRSFLGSLNIAQALGCKKIVHIESDAYILNKKMFKEIQKISSGWWAAWCDSQEFPETAIQVICPDKFGQMRLMSQADPRSFENMLAEKILPFDGFLRQFSGDRYSEFRLRIPKNADFAAQVTPEQKILIR